VAALWVLVAVASLVQTAVGFGFTLLVVTLGSSLLPVEAVIAIIVPVGWLQTTWLVARERAHVDRALLVSRVLPWMLGGMALSWLAIGADPDRWRPLLGVMVLVLAVRELARLGAAPASRAASIGGVVVAGVVHGLFATGGPPLVWALGREGLGKRSFRATLAAVWSLLDLVLLVSMAASGRLSWDRLALSAALLPAMAVGIVVGQRLYDHVDETHFRRGVWALLAVAALPLLAA